MMPRIVEKHILKNARLTLATLFLQEKFSLHGRSPLSHEIHNKMSLWFHSTKNGGGRKGAVLLHRPQRQAAPLREVEIGHLLVELHQVSGVTTWKNFAPLDVHNMQIYLH